MFLNLHFFVALVISARRLGSSVGESAGFITPRSTVQICLEPPRRSKLCLFRFFLKRKKLHRDAASPLQIKTLLICIFGNFDLVSQKNSTTTLFCIFLAKHLLTGSLGILIWARGICLQERNL